MPNDEPIALIEIIEETLDKHDVATRDAIEGIHGAYEFLIREVKRRTDSPPPASTRIETLLVERVKLRK